MDLRCPRKLKDFPSEWCSLAVIRLKALRNAEKELSEDEENNCPGCPWAIAHQLSCYCFFKYAAEYLDDNAISDIEIAYLNSLSIDTIKKIEKTAIDKFKKSDLIQELSLEKDGQSIASGGREIDIEHSIII